MNGEATDKEVKQAVDDIWNEDRLMTEINDLDKPGTEEEYMDIPGEPTITKDALIYDLIRHAPEIEDEFVKQWWESYKKIAFVKRIKTKYEK